MHTTASVAPLPQDPIALMETTSDDAEGPGFDVHDLLLPPTDLDSNLPPNHVFEMSPPAAHTAGVAARATALLQAAADTAPHQTTQPDDRLLVVQNTGRAAVQEEKQTEDDDDEDMLLAACLAMEAKVAKRRKVEDPDSASGSGGAAQVAEALPAAALNATIHSGTREPATPAHGPPEAAARCHAGRPPLARAAHLPEPAQQSPHTLRGSSASQASCSTNMPTSSSMHWHEAATTLQGMAHTLEGMAAQLRALASSTALDPWGWPSQGMPPAWVMHAMAEPTLCAHHVFNNVLLAEQQQRWQRLPHPLAALALAAAPFLVPVWRDLQVLDDLPHFVLRMQSEAAASRTASPHSHGVGATPPRVQHQSPP